MTEPIVFILLLPAAALAFFNMGREWARVFSPVANHCPFGDECINCNPWPRPFVKTHMKMTAYPAIFQEVRHDEQGA